LLNISSSSGIGWLCFGTEEKKKKTLRPDQNGGSYGLFAGEESDDEYFELVEAGSAIAVVSVSFIIARNAVVGVVKPGGDRPAQT
jgi:hypothetical protein